MVRKNTFTQQRFLPSRTKKWERARCGKACLGGAVVTEEVLCGSLQGVQMDYDGQHPTGLSWYSHS